MKVNLQEFLPKGYNIDSSFRGRRIVLKQSSPSYKEEEIFLRKNKESYDAIDRVCVENYGKVMFLIETLAETTQEERTKYIEVIRRFAAWFKVNAIGVYDHMEKEHMASMDKIHAI